MRNGTFLIGVLVHMGQKNDGILDLQAVVIQILCCEKCVGNVPQVTG